jgi:hypothetical protein
MKVITIGRSPENNIVIGDPKVSRHHLQIILDDYGNFRIADFGSSNGTFVNGRRIFGEATLNPDDIIRIGDTTLPWRSYFSNNMVSRGGYMNTGGHGKDTGSTPATPPSPKTMPPTYLWQSIVVTLLCCWPCGIPAIVYAAQVEKRFLRGDYDGAEQASANAKTWTIVSFSLAALSVVIYLIYCFAVGASVFALLAGIFGSSYY